MNDDGIRAKPIPNELSKSNGKREIYVHQMSGSFAGHLAGNSVVFRRETEELALPVISHESAGTPPASPTSGRNTPARAPIQFQLGRRGS